MLVLAEQKKNDKKLKSLWILRERSALIIIIINNLKTIN